MQLTDKSILRFIHESLKALGANIDDSGLRYRIAATDSAVRELILRTDSEFYTDYFLRGRKLAEEGLFLAPQDSLKASFLSLPESISPSLNINFIDQELSRLLALLRDIVKCVGSSEEANDYFAKVSNWEFEIAARRATSSQQNVMLEQADKAVFTKVNVENYLREHFSAKDLKVVDFEPLAGGFSKNTIMLTTFDKVNGNQEMVIRANLAVPNMKIDGADIRNEYPIVEMAFKAGLPLPEPLWLELNTELLGTCFAVFHKAAGKTIGSGHTSELFGEITADIKADIVDVLVRIHQQTVTDKPKLSYWASYNTSRDCAIATAEYWMEEVRRHQLDNVGPSLQRIYDWLISNAPYEEKGFKPVFLHGDYGLHNILFSDNRLSSVLDWELAKLGDPAEDFTTLFYTLGVDYDEELIDMYQARGGQRISKFRVYYYRILLLLRALIFDAVAIKNLASDTRANIYLFSFIAGPSYAFSQKVNEMIELANEARANQ